jgi:LmbE family N-acetylglucosaminyl deacetylase
MLPLSFAGLQEALVLGAHCDDVEIGCGGTLCALAARPNLKLHVAVFSGDAVRTAETRAAIDKLLRGANYQLDVFEFRDGFFPVQWAAIKEQFELLKGRCRPDVVFTHYADDKHQDHRLLSELTLNTFRSQAIFEYEIPKYDGDLGRPQLYVPLSAEQVNRKLAALLESFASQAGKRWFSEELFRSLLRLRGMECNAESGYAEAFFARKWTLRC